MISVIVCSINPSFLNKLKINIENTIGVTYEILVHDNRISNEGLCSVYNKLGKQAVYEIICFIHEDIQFETNNWGRNIVQHLQNKATGLIGVAGGDAKSIVPSTWSTTFKSKEMNVLQRINTTDIYTHVCFTYAEKRNSKNVVALDGMFLCTRKDVFKDFQFDDHSLKGFHGYDIDYSLQVLTKYEVHVVFDVLIAHFSMGHINKAWMQSTIIIAKKWKNYLPISTYNLTKAELKFFHWKTLQVFLQNLMQLEYDFLTVTYYYLRYSFTKYFSVRRFLSMAKYVFSEIKRHKNEDSITDMRLANLDKSN